MGISREPLIDVILPVFDVWHWADLAIRSVENMTSTPCRLIIVDGASRNPNTIAGLAAAEERGHTVVRLAENRSFANAVNSGIRAGSAKTIVVLNDDAIVTEGWDKFLLQDLSDRTVGLVGARASYAAGAQGNPSLSAKLGDEPPFLVFVCVAMRREVYDAVGPLDEETFDGWSGEDVDYGIRMWKAGYRVKVSNAFVLHAGSRTLAATLGGNVEGRQKNDLKYIARLEEKWGAQFVRQEISRATKGPRVFITTMCPHDTTNVLFVKSLMDLKLKAGSSFEFHFHWRCALPAIGRQAVATYALQQGFDYIVMFDDDATFPPDTLERLLAHDKDYVAALAYQRNEQHKPCVYEFGEDRITGGHLEKIENTGLRKVDVTGMHVIAIKVSVFQRLKEAGIENWFQFYTKNAAGKDVSVGEDFALCLNMEKIGIPRHCDTGLIPGHLGDRIIVDEAYVREYSHRQTVGSLQPART